MRKSFFFDDSFDPKIPQNFRSNFFLPLGFNFPNSHLKLADFRTVKITDLHIGNFLIFQQNFEFDPRIYWTILQILSMEDVVFATGHRSKINGDSSD